MKDELREAARETHPMPVRGEVTGMRAILIVAAMAVIGPGLAQSQSAKEKYELTERCGRSAAKFFDRQTKEFRAMHGRIRWVHSTYENHYNSSLSKCFILEQTITTNDRDHRLDYSLFSITEVNENMEYGVYWGQNGMCWVLGKH